MDLESYSISEEGSRDAVLAALRKSSKGQLPYDRYWPQENPYQDGLPSTVVIHLDSRLLPLRFEPDSPSKDSIDGTQSPDVPPREEGSSERSWEAKSPKDDTQDLTAYVSGAEHEISIHHYEEERLSCVNAAVKKRLALYEEQQRRWEEQAMKHVMLIEQNQTLQYRQELDRLNREYLQGLQELAEKSQKAREHHQSHVRHLRNKIKEAELKQKQQEEEEKRREAESQQRAVALRGQCQEMESTLASVRRALEECPFAPLLSTPVGDHLGLLDRMARQVAAFGTLAAVSREDLTHVLDFATRLNSLVHAVVADVEQATIKGMATQKEEQERQQQAALAEQNLMEGEQVGDTGAQLVPSPAGPSQGGTDQLKYQSDLLDRLQQWQDSYKELTKDKSQKQYLFDLLKAVTIPVNSLATMSAVKEKMHHLSNLLSGKPMKSGSRTFTVTAHPLALRYCLDKLAEKIVLQGEEQIVASGDTAFPIASLAVGLWCRFPDLGDLLLAHFYMRCPALVPVFFSRDAAASDVEYLRLCGYKCIEENQLETETQFVRRVGGLAWLYAAILQTPLPPWHSEGGDNSPPGPERAWQWMALCMNAPIEEPSLMATLVATFFEVAGWVVARDYGRQFRKLLHCLCKDYFPRLKQKEAASSGPVLRLEGLLQKVLRRGQVARPQASLAANTCWR